MPLFPETIALPITKGLDVQTDARLLNPPALLEAENTQFSGGGAKKRKGYTALKVRTEGSITSTDGLSWVFGPGWTSGFRPSGQEATTYYTTGNADVERIYGTFTRDNETVLWDGFRLLSYLPSQGDAQAPRFAEVSGPAVLPSLRAMPLGKANETQGNPEFADNGEIKVMAWVSDGAAKYHIFDSESDALIAHGALTSDNADYLRVFTLGSWVHIAVRDNDDDKVELFSINSAEPNDITFRSYGDATHFDLWKVSDSEAVLARTNPEGVFVTWIAESGTGSGSRTHFDFVPSTVRTLVSVGVAGNEIGVATFSPSDSTLHLNLFTFAGLQAVAETSFLATSCTRLTVAPKVLKAANNIGFPIWDLYWDDNSTLYRVPFWRDDFSGFVTTGSSTPRYHLRIASRAFRVGDRTFLWAGHSSTLQATWFLLDEGLLPVGKMDFGVAEVTGTALRGINFKSGEDYDSTTPRFQLALNYRLRVVPPGVDQATSGIYTEASPKAVTLDFLPRLRTAQAGRTTYIAGAQLWAYDGAEIVEAGFHLGPEPTLEESNGGALTALGTYSYRVDLCHRNAQNEEVRSLSILTNSLELTGTEQTITLTIPTVLTRREDSYFLIYRNAMSSGTPLVNWWLLNSRDPSDPTYLANDLSVDEVVFVDDGDVSDTAIQSRELHPASDTYVQPISAPACEVIAAGRDRLWVSGGELPPGKVAPSRLFSPDEVPSFNAYLEFQVDRGNERITGMGFLGEVAVFFRRNSTYILDSDGPDNNASGFWNPPRLALADVGAISQDSVVRTTSGLIFQSPAGFRMVGPGGALTPIGVDIDSAAKDFDVVGSLLSEVDQEARFYGSDGTYVFNYLYGTWARWTCSGIGVAKNAEGIALLAREDGYLWVEDDVYTDGGITYTHRIRTSWLHGGSLGDFQRVRRIGGLGRFADTSNPNHSLRLELFYDERDFWEERVEWTLPDSTTNEDTWGAGDYGDGVWGDTSALVGNIEDSTWDWVRRPSRQKCSVISIALEDVNTDGPGFVLSAFTLELAKKQGLNRTPERTGTGSFRE